MTDVGSLAAAPLFGLPLPELWFALLFALLGAYLLLDGFDFGVGILFATRSDEGDRERLLASIGPFWDGNEVWLVVFGGSLFAAFPSAYANLLSRHYLLGFAILLALGLRGLAPELYEQREDDRWRRLWGLSFVVGSASAPFLVGVLVANWVFGATGTVTLTGVTAGLALVALAVVDGVAFLGLKTRGDLRPDATAWGVRAAAGYVVFLTLTLGGAYATRPFLRSSLRSPAGLGLVAATAGLAVAYVAAIRARRYPAAFATVSGLVVALVALLGLAAFPYVDPAVDLTVRNGVVSTLPLNLMSVGAAVLLPLVSSYFVVLYNAFGGPTPAE